MRVDIQACHSFPTEIVLENSKNELHIAFDDGSVFDLPVEYLRVFTQSAEAVGHGPGQETLQTGKRFVRILDIRQIGQYAIAFTFDDGHDSGIYTWDLLYKLGTDFPRLWAAYLDKLAAAGLDRSPPNFNLH